MFGTSLVSSLFLHSYLVEGKNRASSQVPVNPLKLVPFGSRDSFLTSEQVWSLVILGKTNYIQQQGL